MDTFSQVDGNYTIEEVSSQSDSVVSPNVNGDRYWEDRFSPTDPEPFFIDEELSDQESVFGYNHIENMTTTLSDSLGLEDQELEATTVSDQCNRLIACLNLDIPTGGYVAHNRVYRLPSNSTHLISSSESNISRQVLHPQPQSSWYRRWVSFKRFLSRVTL